MKRFLVCLLSLMLAAPGLAADNVVSFPADPTTNAACVYSSASLTVKRADGHMMRCYDHDSDGTATWRDITPLSSSAFTALTSGTNGLGDADGTAAAMVVGQGSTLGASGTGAITATNMVGTGSTTNAVDLATAEVSGTLPAGNGGMATLPNQQVPFSNGSSYVGNAGFTFDGTYLTSTRINGGAADNQAVVCGLGGFTACGMFAGTAGYSLFGSSGSNTAQIKTTAVGSDIFQLPDVSGTDVLIVALQPQTLTSKTIAGSSGLSFGQIAAASAPTCGVGDVKLWNQLDTDGTRRMDSCADGTRSTVARVNGVPCADTVAAGTMTLNNCNSVILTGGGTQINNIATCNPANKGRFLQLIASPSFTTTVVNGDTPTAAGFNLRLGVDQSLTADDVLPLICDGTTNACDNSTSGCWLKASSGVALNLAPGGKPETGQVLFVNASTEAVGDPGMIYTEASDTLTLDGDGTPSAGGINFGPGPFPDGDGTLNHYRINITNTQCLQLRSLGYYGGNAIKVCSDTGGPSTPALDISSSDGTSFHANQVISSDDVIYGAAGVRSTGGNLTADVGHVVFQNHTLQDADGTLSAASHGWSNGDGTVAETNKAQTWTQAQTFSAETTHSEGITLADAKAILFPITNPYTTSYGVNTQSQGFGFDCTGDGTNDLDHVLSVASYNTAEGSSGRTTSSTYAFQDQWELSYCPNDGDGDGTMGPFYLEHNSDLTTPAGTAARCFAGLIEADNTPRSSFVWHHNCQSDSAFKMELSSGYFGIYNSSPLYTIDVGPSDSNLDGTLDGGAHMRLRGLTTTYGLIVLGRTTDTKQVSLQPGTLTAQRTQNYPDADGVFCTDPNATGTGSKYWGDRDVAAYDTGTEVCAVRGKTCITSIGMGTVGAGSAEIACGTVPAATTESTTSGYFEVLCQ